MKILIDIKDATYLQWHRVAKFEHGAQAHEAARALSVADGRIYRVIDTRLDDENDEGAILYEDGVAYEPEA